MAVTALQNADASKKGGIRMGKKMMHIGLEPGAVGRYVFLPEARSARRRSRHTLMIRRRLLITVNSVPLWVSWMV